MIEDLRDLVSPPLLVRLVAMSPPLLMLALASLLLGRGWRQRLGIAFAGVFFFLTTWMFA